MIPFGGWRPVSPKETNVPVDWDGVYTGLANWGVIGPALRDLDQRLLALEGREDEAQRRLDVRAKANKAA